MPEFKTKHLKVKKSKTGLGLFAVKTFQKGDFIVEYTGERISSEEADRRGGKYLFEVDRHITIDGKGRENTARYINHSCRPNCEAENDEGQIYIYSTQKIKKGEEIFYDYGKEYFDDFIKPIGCRCSVCDSP